MLRFLQIGVLGLLAATQVAGAEVYRCQGADGVQFSDRPCGVRAVAVPLASPNLMQGGAAASLAERHDRRIAEQRRQRDAEEQAWLRAHEQERIREARVRAARVRGELAVGMSALDVRSLRGDPQRIERGDGREVWIYDARGKTTATVTVENGRVVAVRRGQSRR